MTNELEKQFFDTFGIEPKLDCKKCGAMNFALGQCAEVECKKTYPQITDRILLELILIYSRISNLPICYDTVERFKEATLECFIENSEDYKHQVQALFEEG